MLTVPAPLPAVRPPLPASPEHLAVITARRTGPERWWCGACHGSAATPAPGEPVPGWIEVRADGSVLARACTATCLAKLLPAMKDELSERPWTPPEHPEPRRIGLAALMRERPGGR
jgi:hypothetical protein